MNENSEYEFSILNCREMFTDLSLVEQEGYRKTVLTFLSTHVMILEML